MSKNTQQQPAPNPDHQRWGMTLYEAHMLVHDVESGRRQCNTVIMAEMVHEARCMVARAGGRL